MDACRSLRGPDSVARGSRGDMVTLRGAAAPSMPALRRLARGVWPRREAQAWGVLARVGALDGRGSLHEKKQSEHQVGFGQIRPPYKYRSTSGPRTRAFTPFLLPMGTFRCEDGFRCGNPLEKQPAGLAVVPVRP